MNKETEIFIEMLEAHPIFIDTLFKSIEESGQCESTIESFFQEIDLTEVEDSLKQRLKDAEDYKKTVMEQLR